jgi:predicted Rossmann fold nucleotide-binding protein DprA/Smf involved in DNA uptake
MNSSLSANTQAILLLTAPLIAGRDTASPDLLTPGEYKRLARHLRELQCQPAELLAPESKELLKACAEVIVEDRLRRLLGRGFLLSQAVERWQARAIWVVSRADADYPRRLKTRLREDAPAVLYGCGDRGLLESGGLAVVGSRQVEGALIDYAAEIGRICAEAGKTLVSGGAKGIDQAAMRGVLENGGVACGMLADSLEKNAMNREHRNLLMDGRLALASPYDPNAGFNVGNAMQRNKLVYALADAALVVNAEAKKGGTWAGAVEQLDKLHLVPVYVRSTGELGEGLEELAQKGALPWPNPKYPEDLNAVVAVQSASMSAGSGQLAISLFAETSTPPRSLASELKPRAKTSRPATLETNAPLHPLADALFARASEILRQLLLTPMKGTDIAATLGISTLQAKAWLQRLVDEGVVEKRKKTAVYALKQQSLFEQQDSSHSNG